MTDKIKKADYKYSDPPKFEDAVSFDLNKLEAENPALLGVGLHSVAHPGLSPASLEEIAIAIESPVGGYDVIEGREEAILLCAMLIHNTVKALNDEQGQVTVGFEANRASLIAGIRRVLDNPNESPGENHNAWMAFKVAEGWVYGPNKDPEAKTHPCLVPFEQLPPVERAKDSIFLTIVRTFFGVGA